MYNDAGISAKESPLKRIPVIVSSALTTLCGAADSSLVEMTAQEDRQRLLDLLQVKQLRRGADGRKADTPNATSYDDGYTAGASGPSFLTFAERHCKAMR